MKMPTSLAWDDFLDPSWDDESTDVTNASESILHFDILLVPLVPHMMMLELFLFEEFGSV